MYIKRDDLTGMQLSGNKVRKLEFLLAEAMDQDADCVITIGGVQSNHCRATAVASRYLGLDSHLILRADRSVADAGDPGLVGNLLIERAVGADVHLVTKREYATHGSVALTQGLRRKLAREGKKPYVIPVGGSNAVGTWGYVDAMAELAGQMDGAIEGGCDGVIDGGRPFTDIVMACGSGGTTAGIALGAALCPGLGRPTVSAYGVCDSPEYFYEFVGSILSDMNAPVEDVIGRVLMPGVKERVGGVLRCVQAKGTGYAMATEEELGTTAAVARSHRGTLRSRVLGQGGARASTRDGGGPRGLGRARGVVRTHGRRAGYVRQVGSAAADHGDDRSVARVRLYRVGHGVSDREECA